MADAEEKARQEKIAAAKKRVRQLSRGSGLVFVLTVGRSRR